MVIVTNSAIGFRKEVKDKEDCLSKLKKDLRVKTLLNKNQEQHIEDLLKELGKIQLTEESESTSTPDRIIANNGIDERFILSNITPGTLLDTAEGSKKYSFLHHDEAKAMLELLNILDRRLKQFFAQDDL